MKSQSGFLIWRLWPSKNDRSPHTKPAPRLPLDTSRPQCVLLGISCGLPARKAPENRPAAEIFARRFAARPQIVKFRVCGRFGEFFNAERRRGWSKRLSSLLGRFPCDCGQLQCPFEPRFSPPRRKPDFSGVPGSRCEPRCEALGISGILPRGQYD
jgi:hypothetical protein